WQKGTGWRSDGEETWGLVLSPEGPLCLAGRRLADNIFESEGEISGAVLKGALACMIQRLEGIDGADISQAPDDSVYRGLRQEFSRLRILHGKAVKQGERKRPGVVPLSCVKLGPEDEVRDLALSGDVQPVQGMAPAFRVDWKGAADVERLFGGRAPNRELR